MKAACSRLWPPETLTGRPPKATSWPTASEAPDVICTPHTTCTRDVIAPVLTCTNTHYYTSSDMLTGQVVALCVFRIYLVLN